MFRQNAGLDSETETQLCTPTHSPECEPTYENKKIECHS